MDRISGVASRVENIRVAGLTSYNGPSAKREDTHRTLAGTLGEMAGEPFWKGGRDHGL